MPLLHAHVVLVWGKTLFWGNCDFFYYPCMVTYMAVAIVHMRLLLQKPTLSEKNKIIIIIIIIKMRQNSLQTYFLLVYINTKCQEKNRKKVMIVTAICVHLFIYQVGGGNCALQCSQVNIFSLSIFFKWFFNLSSLGKVSSHIFFYLKLKPVYFPS